MDPKELGQQIVEELRRRLGDAWDDRFTQAHRDLAAAVANDAAALALGAMAGADPETVARERSHVQAALANITAIEASRMHAAFWAAAADVVQRGIAALLMTL